MAPTGAAATADPAPAPTAAAGARPAVAPGSRAGQAPAAPDWAGCPGYPGYARCRALRADGDAGWGNPLDRATAGAAHACSAHQHVSETACPTKVVWQGRQRHHKHRAVDARHSEVRDALRPDSSRGARDPDHRTRACPQVDNMLRDAATTSLRRQQFADEYALHFRTQVLPKPERARKELHSGKVCMAAGTTVHEYVCRFKSVILDAAPMMPADSIYWCQAGLNTALKAERNPDGRGERFTSLDALIRHAFVQEERLSYRTQPRTDAHVYTVQGAEGNEGQNLEEVPEGILNAMQGGMRPHPDQPPAKRGRGYGGVPCGNYNPRYYGYNDGYDGGYGQGCRWAAAAKSSILLVTPCVLAAFLPAGDVLGQADPGQAAAGSAGGSSCSPCLLSKVQLASCGGSPASCTAAMPAMQHQMQLSQASKHIHFLDLADSSRFLPQDPSFWLEEAGVGAEDQTQFAKLHEKSFQHGKVLVVSSVGPRAYALVAMAEFKGAAGGGGLGSTAVYCAYPVDSVPWFTAHVNLASRLTLAAVLVVILDLDETVYQVAIEELLAAANRCQGSTASVLHP
jgi:hypothetical protein